MKNRTTKKERIELEYRVMSLVNQWEDDKENDIMTISDKYVCIRKINSWKYNPTNLFKQLGIYNLLPAYHNAISDRENYHTKNDSYYKILKALNL